MSSVCDIGNKSLFHNKWFFETLKKDTINTRILRGFNGMYLIMKNGDIYDKENGKLKRHEDGIVTLKRKIIVNHKKVIQLYPQEVIWLVVKYFLDGIYSLSLRSEVNHIKNVFSIEFRDGDPTNIHAENLYLIRKNDITVFDVVNSDLNRPCVRYNLSTNEEINEFESIISAARECNVVDPYEILNVCNGKKKKCSTYGWKFSD